MARRVRRSSWPRIPAHMTPMLEAKQLPKGGIWESCAIMQYLSNKHQITKFYPKAAAKRAMIDSAMFYIIGTLYPLVARATYPALGFPQYPGRSGRDSADAAHKAEAQKAALEAIAEPLEVFHKFYMDGKPFIGGAKPSIADIRLAATLEFLAVVDYKLPAWAKTYMSNMEKALGKAYTEPAGDVRGYIAYVKDKESNPLSTSLPRSLTRLQLVSWTERLSTKGFVRFWHVVSARQVFSVVGSLPFRTVSAAS